MIHRYKNNGYNIVLDVNSGCVHVVDEIAYDAIGLYEENREDAGLKLAGMYPQVSKEDIEELIAEIDVLKENGELFSEDIYEDYIIDVSKREISEILEEMIHKLKK